MTLNTTNLGAPSPLPEGGKSLRIPIERTSQRLLRALCAAAHVERFAPRPRITRMSWLSQSPGKRQREISLAIWFVPLVGALSPAIVVAIQLLVLSSGQADVRGELAVWFFRDAFLGYSVVLPVVSILRRLGFTAPALLWVAAAMVGLPMGYVLANPVEYTISPTDEEFQHGPYWPGMYIYAALFGLTGLAYGIVHQMKLRCAGRIRAGSIY